MELKEMIFKRKSVRNYTGELPWLTCMWQIRIPSDSSNQIPQKPSRDTII